MTEKDKYQIKLLEHLLRAKKIATKIKNGQLTKETDKRGTNGFWDLAGDIAGTNHTNKYNPQNSNELLQCDIYHLLWLTNS